MTSTNVGCVPVFVRDQSRAVEFYRDKLGFEVVMDVPMGPEVRWITVAPKRGATELILFHPRLAGAGGQAEEVEKRVGTWTGIVLLTGDCRAEHGTLAQRGVKFTAEPKQPFWGGWISEFADPDGNTFQLVERPAHMR